jgi:bifunctional non-homologous end joining protein LigD
VGRGEERLAPYRRKRDFARTPEPAGDRRQRARRDAPRRFVVQRHRARRLHYDFRLEIDGVLVSWAVPKGPTLDPKARRIAIPTEDHPLEYYDFEGVIPAGEYGGGDVIVWDNGTWEPADGQDPARALAEGELHFDVTGHKLRGRFVLVRTDGRGRGGRGPADRGGRGRAGRAGARDSAEADGTGASERGREQWLLLHKRDEYAAEGWNPEEHPLSVLSGRTNDEVKDDPDRLWRSDLPVAAASVSLKPSTVDSVSDEELAELDALGSEGRWHVFGRELRVTNLDKVLFPGRPHGPGDRATTRRGRGRSPDGGDRTGKSRKGDQPAAHPDEPPVTKRDLLRYAAQIAPVLLPYLSRRALNLHRFPDGIDGKAFWQRDLPDHAPDWLPRWEHRDSGSSQVTTQLVVDEPAALVWAANFGAIEWHPWTSCVDSPDQPTYALIDIDPGEESSWEDVLTLARLHRTAFEHLGVVARPKLSGQRGIQIWVPIVRGPSFRSTRAWVQGLSKSIGQVVPDLVSWQWQRRERGGRARLDYTQNAINKTLVAPYSPRPAPGAPVSAPIDWDELDDPTLRPDAFTIRTILPRLQQRGDLFADVLHAAQSLPPLR